jgi:ATP phosphoribosyltransferase
MEKNMAQLKLGIPKGSLEKATVDLFAQAGWNIRIHSRNYFPSVDDTELVLSLVRPQEMAAYIADGTLDLGLTGWDWIIERDCQDKVTEVATLEYSKTSNQACRWVLVTRQDSPIKTIEDLQGKRIATELEGFTRRFLAERGVTAEVIFSWGATEAKVVDGLVDAVVEITETGSTIKAHGLRIVADLLETQTKLIANPKALEDPWKKKKVDQISMLLNAALDARHKVMLKMNMPTANAMDVVKLLPSLQAPTINPLTDPNWQAVETVVDRTQVRDLIPLLKAAGAVGILEYDLRKVL